MRTRLALAGLLLLSACGTRLEHHAVVAATASNTAEQTDGDAGAVTNAAGATASSSSEELVASDPSLPAAEPGSGGVARRPTAGGATAMVSPRTARNRTAAVTKTPVRLASVGTVSGPAASSLIGTIAGLQGWIRDVNARGGVNGHPVKVAIVDDGADPARHRAQVQEQVEGQKILAFIQNNEPFSGAGSVEYITSKRVPVIGSETASSWFYKSPMYFPQASSGRNLLVLSTYAIVQQLVPKGITKVGTLVCTEAAICAEADQVWNDEAPRSGLRPVYRGKASLAQPDFTAECLAARNAGAQMIQIALDTNSVGRVGASCARQGYRPIFVTGASVIADRLKDDRNLNVLGASNVFPWFQTNTPATAAFRAAMGRYVPNAVLGIGAAQGWVSGKMFEKAAANLPEPPTRAALLDGLWSLKDDTLGGLTQPLTFIRDKPAPNVACWFNIATRDGRWVTLDDYRLQCR